MINLDRKLPPVEKKEWFPIVKRGNTIPFGYRQDDRDPLVLNPIEEELELLEDAKRFVKQYSYRSVAAWLSQKSGRYISHVGLKNRIERERKTKRQEHSYRVLADKLEKTLEKIKELETKRLGGSGTNSTCTSDPSSD